MLNGWIPKILQKFIFSVIPHFLAFINRATFVSVESPPNVLRMRRGGGSGGTVSDTSSPSVSTAPGATATVLFSNGDINGSVLWSPEREMTTENERTMKIGEIWRENRRERKREGRISKRDESQLVSNQSIGVKTRTHQ